MINCMALTSEALIAPLFDTIIWIHVKSENAFPAITYALCSELCIECWRCDNCAELIHLVWSQLPMYYQVNYFISGFHYACNRYVLSRGEDKYN